MHVQPQTRPLSVECRTKNIGQEDYGSDKEVFLGAVHSKEENQCMGKFDMR